MKKLMFVLLIITTLSLVSPNTSNDEYPQVSSQITPTSIIQSLS